MGRTVRPLRVSLALIAAGALVFAGLQLRSHSDWQLPPPISGPFATLLAISTNLGDSQAETVELTAELRGPQRPDRLEAWAAANGLSVRWQPGDGWAVVQGPPAHIATALRVAVHDYRGRAGQVFYASPQQPAVPASLNDTVAGLGRILSYTPYHSNSPSFRPLEVPDHSLPPDSLRTTYNVRPLTEAGYTGKGTTIAVFGFDGFDQADLDMFTAAYGLPKLTPEILGGMPEQRSGESTMDLQVAHAIAPDAQKVLVNARTTVAGGSTYVKIA